MKIEQVCQPLNAYFSQHRLFRLLLPLSMPLMFVCVALRLLENFVTLGALVSALSFLGFFLFVLMVVSTCNFRMTALGLGLFAVDYVMSLLKNLIGYHRLSWGSLVYVLVFGYLAYVAYHKSVSFNR